MWDSSKTTKYEDPYGFNAIELTIEMCAQHQIELAEGAIISFPKGWKVLFLTFLNNLKQYPVILTEIIDTYGQLDIKFEMKSKRGELHVRRLIDCLREESRDICMECGSLTNLTKNPDINKWICESCYKSTKQGKTGTWLDKY